MSAAVRLSILAGLICLANCEIQSLSQIKTKKVPFKVCIDDSDCMEQGDEYACFQYICYPWKDDSKLAKEDRKKTCKSTDHCPNNLVCHRHSDRRKILKGLCMEPIVDCSENGETDCISSKGYTGPNRACCNGAVCCKQEYFDQLKQLPCVGDESCKDMGYGNYCCPQKTNGLVNATLPKQCCNENPNPTTTTTTTRRPKSSSSTSGSELLASSFMVSIIMMVVTLSLRQ